MNWSIKIVLIKTECLIKFKWSYKRYSNLRITVLDADVLFCLLLFSPKDKIQKTMGQKIFNKNETKQEIICVDTAEGCNAIFTTP